MGEVWRLSNIFLLSLKLLKLALCISILSALSIYNCKADITGDHYHNTILFVGVSPQELSLHEQDLTRGRYLVEVPRTNNWQESIKRTEAAEIVLKQSSGFVGLYDPLGHLIRSVSIVENEGNKDLNPEEPAALQSLTYQQNFDYGYLRGGRVDPYQPLPQTVYADNVNYAKLTPGYGYNSNYDKPRSKRSLVVDFLNYAPIDVVTPLNYPGNFDQHNLTVAYGLGVVPHIAGLLIQQKRAQAEKSDYEYYKQQQPLSYVESPPVIYQRGNPAEPTNPITSDPNFIRMQEMPQAFQRDFPGYANNPLGFGSSINAAH